MKTEHFALLLAIALAQFACTKTAPVEPLAENGGMVTDGAKPSVEYRRQRPNEILQNLPVDHQAGAMRPLDFLLGTMLETWNHRYAFTLDRAKWVLRFNVPGFELAAEEDKDGIALSFEEAGKTHRVICTLNEAPKVIEALLFPE